MSVYSSGSCRVRVGSAEVRGNNTLFTTYVTAGDLFKITSESTFYTVAAVTTATKLTLSSRYANTSFQTGRTENTGTAVISDTTYSGILDHTPAIQSKVTIKVTAKEKFRDDGAGVLTGSLGGSGTISYDDGAWAITMGADPGGTKIITASYNSGDTMNGQSYQIVRNYTTYHKLPEADPVDKNLAYIYTKAVRMIDSKMNAASMTSASIDNLNVRNNIERKVLYKTTNYTATANDAVIVVSGNSASVWITAPSASKKNIGKSFIVIHNGSYRVRVRRKSGTSDLLNAATRAKMATRYYKKEFLCATKNLYIVSRSRI